MFVSNLWLIGNHFFTLLFNGQVTSMSQENYDIDDANTERDNRFSKMVSSICSNTVDHLINLVSRQIQIVWEISNYKNISTGVCWHIDCKDGQGYLVNISWTWHHKGPNLCWSWQWWTRSAFSTMLWVVVDTTWGYCGLFCLELILIAWENAATWQTTSYGCTEEV